MSFTVNHNEAKELLQVMLQADVVPFIKGSPAIGKSSLVQQLAKDNNLELIDLRLTQLQPYDLSGLVHPNKDDGTFSYLPLDEFPLENTPIPQNKQGFLLFLDEFNSADKYTAAACYKLILDRAIGKHKLHPNTRIICAGNKLTDGAIAHNLGTAIQSRVVHLELSMEVKSWLDWLENQTDWHKLIHPFLSFRPECINDFDPSASVITYSSPRTWEFLSKQLKNGLLNLPKDIQYAAVMGTVGEKAGQEFMAFLDVFSKLPTIQDITSDPLNCPMPDEIGAKWALGIHLAEHVNQTNQNEVIQFMERMPEADIRVVGYRTIVNSYPEICQNPQLRQSMLELRKQMVQP